MLFKSLLRPTLFRLSAHDPEVAHHWIMEALKLTSHHAVLHKMVEASYTYKSPALKRTLFGVRFPNPVGLAGGFDKNGIALPGLAALGFGFIEAGTVTRYSQPGNPRPRIFRISEEKALINRMGFPNQGADEISTRLIREPKPDIPIAWSIGKSKVTPPEEAVEDYLYSLRKLYDFADFFTVNVSSPNTPGLRNLQEKEPLAQLLGAIVKESQELASQKNLPSAKAILVKIAPDLIEEQLDDIIEVCLAQHIHGIIASNTTLSRASLQRQMAETGGLSGRPLADRSLELVDTLCKKLNGQLPVVGVGGIFTPDDAKRMFDAGASLIQIYTSFIYEGPAIIKQINRALISQKV